MNETAAAMETAEELKAGFWTRCAAAYWSEAVRLDPKFLKGPEKMLREGYSYPPKVWAMLDECFRQFGGSGHALEGPASANSASKL